jgi:uncharacterized LabA/DUF88 family protein
MTTRLAIFIDGGYLDKIAEKESGIRVDYAKFSEAIRSVVAAKSPDTVEILRTYYYHCLPYQRSNPDPSEAQHFASAQKFFYSLERLPRYIVRQGHLVYRGDDKTTGEPIYVQKKIDLQLGLDFALLSAKGQIGHIAVVAGDGDLIPALCVAKDEGIVVWLFHGPRVSKQDGRSTFADDLWQTADERHEMNLGFMKSVQFSK